MLFLIYFLMRNYIEIFNLYYSRIIRFQRIDDFLPLKNVIIAKLMFSFARYLAQDKRCLGN